MFKVWSLNLHKLIMQIFAYHCPRISIYQGPREGSYYALRFSATLHNFGIINNRTNHHIEQYNKNLECPFANCFCRVEQYFKTIDLVITYRYRTQLQRVHVQGNSPISLRMSSLLPFCNISVACLQPPLLFS